MAGSPVTSGVDVSDMKAVHQALRDTLDGAGALVGSAPSGDSERVALISNLYENVLSFLHAHHQTEEDLVFPLLRERCPQELAVVDRAAAQHEEVRVAVDGAEVAVASWADQGERQQGHCAERLAALGSLLGRHLDEEEGQILPLCAAHLSAEEWGAQPGHGMALFSGDKIWLILGLIRQRMTAAQRQEMSAHMPPPAREMWSGFGERAFDELITRVGPPLA